MGTIKGSGDERKKNGEGGLNGKEDGIGKLGRED